MSSEISQTSFKYDAFISYSRVNEPFAEKLEQTLEAFKPTKEMGLRLRYLNIFRDRADFKSGEYISTLEKELRESAKLIVVCSPAARASRYVNQEIKLFTKLRGAEHIIPVLLAGTPNNEAKPEQSDALAFPEALCEALEMPLAVNYLGFNDAKEKVDKGVYTEAWYSILADIYEISRSEIEQRERKRQARARRTTVGALTLISAVLAVFLIFALVSRSRAQSARQEATVQKEVAERALAEAVTARTIAIEAEKQTSEALKNVQSANAIAEQKRQEAEVASENERLARIQSEQRRLQAEREKLKANEALRDNLFESGREELANGFPFRAASYLSAAQQIPAFGLPPVRTFNIRFLLNQALDSIDSLGPALNHQGSVFAARFSPQYGTKVVTTSDDNTVGVWDVASRVRLRTMSVPAPKPGDALLAVTFSPDGRSVLVVGGDGSVKIRDIETDNAVALAIVPSVTLNTAEFSPDGTTVVTGGDDNQATIWDAKTGNLIRSIPHDAAVVTVKFSRDGSKLAVASYTDIKVWDVKSNTRIGSFLHQKGLNSISFSPDAKMVAVAGNEQTIVVWDLINRTKSKKFAHGDPESRHNQDSELDDGLQDGVQTVEFSPDGTKLVSASDEGTAKIWDVGSGHLLATLQHANSVASAKFSTDGTKVVTASFDKTAVVWSVTTGHWLNRLEHSDYVRFAEFSPDGTKIITACDDGAGRIWNVGGDLVWRPTPSLAADDELQDNLLAAKLSRDETRLIIATSTGVQVRDAKTGTDLGNWPNLDSLRDAEFSTDGTKALILNLEDGVTIWDVEQERQLGEVLKTSGEIYCMKFSPDGSRVVVTTDGGLTGELKVFNAITGEVIKEYLTSANEARFSPDGTKVILVDNYETRIWDIPTNTFKTVLEDAGPFYSASFSLDGSKIVTSSNDNLIQIWDARTLEPRSFFAEGKGETLAEFSFNDKWILTRSSKTGTKIWDIESGKTLAVFEDMAFVELSNKETKLVLSGETGIQIRDVSGKTRSSEQIKSIIKKIPFKLLNGAVVPRT